MKTFNFENLISKDTLNYIVANKVLRYPALLLSAYFIYRAGKSLGEFIYYVMN